MSRFQPLRASSYLFKNWLGGLAVVTLCSIQSVAQASITNQARYEYDVVNSKVTIEGATGIINITGLNDDLIDPFGRISGCNGRVLPSYTGFTAILFNTIDRINPTSIAALDRTTLATGGIEPNINKVIPDKKATQI